ALPKVYGDRLFAEHTGKDGAPLEQPIELKPQPIGEDRLLAVTKRFMGEAGGGFSEEDGDQEHQDRLRRLTGLRISKSEDIRKILEPRGAIPFPLAKRAYCARC